MVGTVDVDPDPCVPVRRSPPAMVTQSVQSGPTTVTFEISDLLKNALDATAVPVQDLVFLLVRVHDLLVAE